MFFKNGYTYFKIFTQHFISSGNNRHGEKCYQKDLNKYLVHTYKADLHDKQNIIIIMITFCLKTWNFDAEYEAMLGDVNHHNSLHNFNDKFLVEDHVKIMTLF